MSANGKTPFLTPKQEKFLAYYTDPKSFTFSNALQSALKAGYKQEYAENITSEMPEWLSENLGDLRRLRKAEKNLEEVQNFEVVNDEGKVDVNLLDKRIKVDMFLAERLHKAKYSIRQEVTHQNPDGTNLFSEKTDDELAKIAGRA
jgi:hypothetical protein